MEGMCISERGPARWKAAQATEAGAPGLFLPFNPIILPPEI